MDLAMDPGELVALVATPEQGTAVVRTLVGLAGPASGRVHVGARDVTDLPPGRRQIGYVPAGDGLLPHLELHKNLRLGLEQPRRRLRLGFRHEAGDRQARDRMENLTRAFELGPALHLRPHELVAPQRFHAAVARAVACMHEVLVVDLPSVTPGAMALGEILRRAQEAAPATDTMAVLVCTNDSVALSEVDRTVHGTLVLEPPARRDQAEGETSR